MFARGYMGITEYTSCTVCQDGVEVQARTSHSPALMFLLSSQYLDELYLFEEFLSRLIVHGLHPDCGVCGFGEERQQCD